LRSGKSLLDKDFSAIAKINPRRHFREVNFRFTIPEKNHALVDLRSLLLEPSLQRVYHVVFANTLNNMDAQ
jgi:hypothetical protein